MNENRVAAELDDGPPVISATPPRIDVVLQPAVNAALWHNHVPVLSQLTFIAGSDQAPGDMTIEVAAEPAVVRPRVWRLQAVAAGQIRPMQDLDLALDGPSLLGRTESIRASVLFRARQGGAEGPIVAEHRHDVRVLAVNEWGGIGGLPDILAAFVEPNDPAVAQLLRLTSDRLRAAGRKDALEGYQDKDKGRVWELAEALWRAVSSLDIRYINPPASFEQTGQRIRPPRQVVEERLGTCLDLAVLFASCLEAIGLRPVIVMIEGHAFAGFWLAPHDFGSSVAEDAPGLRTRLALNDILLFETTMVCGRSRVGFRQASAAGAAHVTADKDDAFRQVIDIHRARQRRILPLPSKAEAVASVVEEDAAPVELAPDEAPTLIHDPVGEPDAAPTTPQGRLEMWRRRLLDLSGRNRLLNLKLGGKQALAIDCHDAGTLENALAAMRGRARAQPLRFRPWPSLMDGNDPRSGRIFQARMNEPANRDFAAQALARNELMVGRDDKQLQTVLTEIYRAGRGAQEDGGSNTLFLAIGALLWRESNRSEPYRAPIILVPVVLERPSIRSGFVMRCHDDETRLNATLLEKLKQDFSITFTTLEHERPPEDDSGVDVQGILNTFRAKLRDIPGWEVTEDVALTNLSFTKYLMWKDLADRAQALAESPVARLLMEGRQVGEAVAGATDETRTERQAGSLDDRTAELLCPLEADSSQLDAVAEAAAGKSFVLIGPPGTGKSQTIANIIANTLAQGRSVLFVAEKRAALEVVQRRLRKLELDAFCLDLFSAKTGKAAVLEQLNTAMQARETYHEGHWQTASRELASLRAELNGYVQVLHQRGRNGWTPFRAIGIVLRAEAGGVPDIRLGWPSVDAHDAGDMQRLVEAVEDAAETLRRIGDVATSPVLAGIERHEWSPPWQDRLLDASAQAAARLEALATAAEGAARVLNRPGAGLARDALEATAQIGNLLLRPEAQHGGWALADPADHTMEVIGAARALVEHHRCIKATLAGGWTPGVLALPFGSLLAAWRGAKARWVIPRLLGERAVRRQLAAHAAGPMPADLARELERLEELQSLEAKLAELGTELSPVLGSGWRGLETDFERLEEGFAWGREVRTAVAAACTDPATLLALRSHVRDLVTQGRDLLGPSGAVGMALLRFGRAREDAWAALDALGGQCGSDAIAIADPASDNWVRELAARLQAWQGASDRVRDWCAWRGVVQRAQALGLDPIVRALESGTIAPADAVRTFEANYARWWIGLVVEATPRLRAFVAAQHEKRIERFRALDARMLEIARRLLRAKLAAGIPDAATRERDREYAVLNRELVKKRMHLPIRQLATRMPTALRRLTPCLMMSPLSVAQYLPADSAPFDLVIFDEASQIPTWDAIGVIGRGRQVIVVGDPKQLPPTRFFERHVPDGASGEDGVAVEIQDLESILEECLAANLPKAELTWHYRSRHESLIAFSNHAYYGGRLVTFPAPVTRDRAVSFRHVADGVYARGGGRHNEAEARAVVGEALAILRRNISDGAEQSLGIVTFNAEQQTLIENLLDEARREDPSLEPFFSEDVAEPVLIKNLESVQGEERDIMLFSLTYGPDQAGRVAMNFGPLNQAGGERRLNVAVTRAREGLVVFSSLHPDQIDLARTSAVGVQHLKQFLAMAVHGPAAVAAAAAAPMGEHESPFEVAVAEQLRARGWMVHPQIGVSGFRIDLGVVDPDAPGAFLAGVECDGATYHRGATARDRDRLRQAVLEGLGWRILRVWSTDWWTKSKREADRLHAALTEAHQEASARRAEAAAAVAEAAAAAARHVVQDLEQEKETAIASAAEPPAAAPQGEPAIVEAVPAVDTAPPPLNSTADPARFYDDDYRAEIASQVEAELEAAGPLRQDRLVQRIARAHGFQRAGREIQDRVIASIPGRCARTHDDAGTFVWPANQEPDRWGRFRRPPNGRSVDPQELPIEELIVLARQCLDSGQDEAAILTMMRDACGMKMLREAARTRCRLALELAGPGSPVVAGQRLVR